jgi:hypothetical protein
MSLTASPPRQQIVDKINSYLQTNGDITAAQHKEIELLLVDAIYGAQIGDIKEIACNQQYIIDNFEPPSNLINEGKGKINGERYGWAICNGKNGTINKMGRVAIGYDPVNYPITTAGSNVGGTKDVQLSINQMPTHSHDIQFRLDSSSVGNFLTLPFQDTANSDEGSWRTELGEPAAGNVRIMNKGGNQAHPNMQPYIVTLFIQRIPTT